MKTKTIWTTVIVLVIVSLAMWGIIAFVQSVKTPGQYDDFAQCLTNDGLKFYGAFWCPHCQQEKQWFGKSAALLPYIECSTSDAQGQTQICKDNNIEGYPTWVYPKPITVTSDTDPTICPIQPGPADQPSACTADGSKFYKVWLFSNVKILSSTDPVQTGNTWTFPAESRTQGEVPLNLLSQFSGCALPASATSSTTTTAPATSSSSAAQ